MSRGGVPERSNGAVLKTAGPSRASWVRIPPPPHDPKFEPASLPLGYVSDLYALLRAIDETMPKDATLYVEGSSIARAVREFLGARPAASHRELERGTRNPSLRPPRGVPGRQASAHGARCGLRRCGGRLVSSRKCGPEVSADAHRRLTHRLQIPPG